ncbi:MAG: CHAT domain-containing protein, partial [Actinomycetota bacterium]|nr:CHAT domain-containing protein [Actinomycetota bacterium]
MSISRAIDEVRRRLSGGGVLRDGMGSSAPADVLSMREVGVMLADSFLPEPVRSRLAEVLDEAASADWPVRLGIDASGKWGALPWEALADPVSGEPLSLHPLVTLFRRVPTAKPRVSAGPLEIVVAVSSPEIGGGELLDYERELRDILAAVRSARQADARVRIVPFATTGALRDELDRAPAHVLHLTGHGRPGVLVLEDGEGAARDVSAEQLVAEAIPPGRMPPVIALAACHTDVPEDPKLGSFARELLARGARLVIATETSVSDRYATSFFARVYRALAATDNPDVVQAVADARRLVQQQLRASADERDRQLAARDEWSVITVLAGDAQVPLIDPTLAARAEHRETRTSAIRGVLGRAVGEFVGRRREVRRWPRELVEPANVGMVIHGLGGIGKTTLADEMVRRTVEREPDRLVVVIAGVLTVDGVFASLAARLRQELHGLGGV